MTPDNWLELELLWGVNNPMLQKRLLQQRNPTLKDLISIATQWQSAESTQISFSTETSEYVRSTHDTEIPTHAEEEEEEIEDFDCKKMSDYKREGKTPWTNRQKGDRRQPRTGTDQCTDCGAHGDQMHNRDKCPAHGAVCFLCNKIGHFRHVCRSSRPQNSNKYVGTQ